MGNKNSSAQNQTTKSSAYLIENCEVWIKQKRGTTAQWRKETHSETIERFLFSHIYPIMRAPRNDNQIQTDFNSLKEAVLSYQLSDSFLNLIGTIKKTTKHVEFGVALHQEFMKKLGTILNEPVIKIKGEIRKENVQAGQITVRKFAVRFKCSDVDQTGRVREVYRIPRKEFVEYTHPARAILKHIKIRCSVSIEWSSSDVAKLSNNELGCSLYHDDSTKDITIVTDDKSEIKCHSLILQASSDVFKAMLSPSTGMVESRTKRIELGNVSKEGVKLMVRHLYGVEMSLGDISPAEAMDLFQTAHQFRLSRLEKDMMNLLTRKSPEWFGANVLLELYFYVRNLSEHAVLRNSVLDRMTRIHKEIISCSRFKELNREEAVGLLGKLLEVKLGS